MTKEFLRLIGRRWQVTLVTVLAAQVALWAIPLDRLYIAFYIANTKAAHEYYLSEPLWVVTPVLNTLMMLVVGMTAWNIYGIVQFVARKIRESRA